MGDPKRMEELLKGPLYVYDLPPALLATLTAKTTSQPVANQTPEPTPQDKEIAAKESAIATSTSCPLCKVSYGNVQDQRSHVRSDHHRYNLKAQLRGNAPLDEIQFVKAVGELDESISGSESSESDEEEADGGADTTLTALLKRQAKVSESNEEPEATANERSPKNPLFWLSSSGLPSNKSLGIYRAIFSNVEQDAPTYLVDTIRKKQLAPVKARTNNTQSQTDNSASSPHIFMCMIGGGHFAAMLVSLAPEIHRKQGGVEERQARVIAHKTFHRYTTRRKQGGSQSASDASRGAAHSAGSSLRRYNEAALEKDIRDLLADWKQMIDSAELLFIRATGKTNRRILFEKYEGQVLKQNDPRLRGFPFNTRRATQGELMRCFKELTRVKVSEIDEAALEAAAAAAAKQKEDSKPSTPRPQSQKPKLSKEEEAALLHTSQLQAFIRRSKVPALMSYISNNSIPSDFIFQPTDSPQNFRCPTPIHLAANLNVPAVVTALLTRANSDPTAVNSEGRTPFELTGDRATRDAFRIARHELGESKWNWNAAKVPSAVSRTDANIRAERERKEAEEEESNRRKAGLERLKKEDAERAVQQASSKPGGRTLGAVEKTAAEKRDEETRGMTPEMRMRLERERRARAAEERFRKMQGN
ncbi:hypothetical protein N7462_003793 [Penicillium macrosclerotiorum]|uniref:uncharacterized protein n=1 Tax=Penicillium macrosclerotiorum TaxID=303699 RepID=UPI002546FC1E|nr:uncharacterized protein N7462_003793 [Penicillium macrosclerotiorum]KAJ5689401.1 hypothetical protein N7462_003793 [Penicillium macrosclerotiorum]